MQGESEFLVPTRGQYQILRQRKPWRLKWIDKQHADPIHVACGNGFSLFSISGSVDFKGHHLFGMGMNTESQIGVHEENNKKLKYVISPSKIDLPFNPDQASKLRIIDISCGRAHTAVVTNMGIVTFGNNSYGQCSRPIVENEDYFGNRSIVKNVNKYFELAENEQIVYVKAGQDHTCFLTNKGKVLTCGWSADGQLGQDIYTVSSIPKVVKGDLEGNVIKQIATKGDFVLALSEKGELFGWGNNEYGQLSMSGSNEVQIGIPRHLKLPTAIQRPIRSVAASGTHCLVVDNSFNVWVWGYGLLGRGPKCEQTNVPLPLPNTLFGVYSEIEHTQSKQAISVRCGLNSSAVILNDGSLFMWGKNKYGNLGTGEKIDAFIPLRVNLPARVSSIDCGPDQTFAICRTNL